jgi:rod shape-determining protein MreC
MTFVRRRWTALHTILAIACVAVAWGILPIGIKSCSKDTLVEAQAPLWLALRDLNELQDTAALKLRSKDELIALIEELAGTQAGLELKLQTLQTVEDQKRRLEEQLRLGAPVGYETRLARVIRRDLTGWWQQIWIDKGRAHGVRVGQGVIYSEGVVGRVREAYEQISVVELITSPRFRMAAQLVGDRRPFVYSGMGLGLSQRPYGRVQALQPEVASHKIEGEKIVTTGLSGSFPEGLPIAELEKTEGMGEGGLLEASARLPEQLRELNEVTILIPYR